MYLSQSHSWREVTRKCPLLIGPSKALPELAMWFSQGNLENRNVHRPVEGCRQQSMWTGRKSTKQAVKLVWALHTCHLLRLALQSTRPSSGSAVLLRTEDSFNKALGLPDNWDVRSYSYSTFLLRKLRITCNNFLTIRKYWATSYRSHISKPPPPEHCKTETLSFSKG